MAGSMRRLRQNDRTPGQRVRDREQDAALGIGRGTTRGSAEERGQAARNKIRQDRIAAQRAMGLRGRELSAFRDISESEATEIKNKRGTDTSRSATEARLGIQRGN